MLRNEPAPSQTLKSFYLLAFLPRPCESNWFEADLEMMVVSGKGC